MYLNQSKRILKEEEFRRGKSISDIVNSTPQEFDKLEIIVTNEKVGSARVNGFTKEGGRTSSVYEVPLYKVILRIKGTESESYFKAIRFGVLQKGEDTGTVVGLSEENRYTCQKWDNDFEDLDGDTNEKGAWGITGSFKIIDGIDDIENDIGAAYGHIEICEKGAFGRLRWLIKEWSGANDATQNRGGEAPYNEIIQNGLLDVKIEACKRPKLADVKVQEVGEFGAKLLITDIESGYAVQTVYGASGTDEIVVPTYEMHLINESGNVAEIYHVTRDAWYNRGKSKNEKGKWELTNRAFEPTSQREFYDSEVVPYPSKIDIRNEEAFELQQLGTTERTSETKKLPAEKFSHEQNTFLNNQPIDDARSKLDEASSVMVHIGGFYEKTYADGSTEQKLAGSYGCFGFIPPNQRFQDKEDCQKVLESRAFRNYDITNPYYQSFVKELVKVRSGNYRVVVEVVKRQNIEKFRTTDKFGR